MFLEHACALVHLLDVGVVSVGVQHGWAIPSGDDDNRVVAYDESSLRPGTIAAVYSVALLRRISSLGPLRQT